MRRRLDHIHAFGQQRAEAGAALEHSVPAARLFMARPIDPAEIIRHRNLRGSGKIGHAHRRSGHPRAVVDQPVEIIEMAVSQLHRLAQHTAIRRLTQHEAFFHPLRQQRRRDIGVEILVKQRDQTADLGSLGGGAIDHRRVINRLLEIFGNRAAIRQNEAFLLVHHHGRAASRVEIEEQIRRCPGIFAAQFIGNVLLAHQQADLA